MVRRFNNDFLINLLRTMVGSDPEAFIGGINRRSALLPGLAANAGPCDGDLGRLLQS